MGREIKRVATDFDWPLGEVWPGYLLHQPCGQCRNETCAWCRIQEWGDARIDPPSGDGWQLWETVSEGSPISPVFDTREGLIDWLCSPAYRTGISEPLTREQAEHLVESGWAPTMVGVPGVGLIPGDQHVPREEASDA